MKASLRKSCVRLLPVLVMLGIVAASSVAGEKVHVGKRWPAAERVSIDQIDHGPFDRLLQKYVNDDGGVNYQAWHASAPDRAALWQYLMALSQADPKKEASREARLAFWINAYNSVTLEGILQKYPLKSIRDYTPKLWGYHIWKDLLLTVGDQRVSLEQIEHEILRKMGEPRIHFAIVCASVGCPRLMNRAFVSESLSEQLNANAKDFFADKNRFRYDVSQGRLEVSPILQWFAGDFGSDEAARMRWMAPFLPDAQARALAEGGEASMTTLKYDWSLNEAKGAGD